MTTIMLLEKNSGLRTTLSRVLRRYGYQVRTFAHPASFINNLKQNGADIYLIDFDVINLVILDTQILTATVNRAFVLTTARLTGWRELKRAYPNLPVLIKPFSLRELLDALINIKSF